MSKTKLAIIIYWLVFVIPSLGYLVVNFYWWLFDGNVLNGEKMGAALCVLMFTGLFGVLVAVEEFTE